ncbi:MAG: DNA/RNA non-specific endonuclease [Lactobacillaceae bacterium]|jgi:DNA-entry nuclease|nr:DNA/RNA non-specific endonuclease [Lactobacillaceae bacterium]
MKNRTLTLFVVLLGVIALVCGSNILITLNKAHTLLIKNRQIHSSVHKASSIQREKFVDYISGKDLHGWKQLPLEPKTTRQFELADPDNLGRTRDAHIQLTAKDLAKGKTATSIALKPKGWHNYDFIDNTKPAEQAKKVRLMHKKNLIDYRLSTLNNDRRNLVALTAVADTGDVSSKNEDNQNCMRYYENHLISWLKSHATTGDRLDLQVTPVYEGNDLVPHEIRLAYLGYDANNQPLEICFNSPLEHVGQHDATVVYIKNQSANADINYANGTATYHS